MPAKTAMKAENHSKEGSLITIVGKSEENNYDLFMAKACEIFYLTLQTCYLLNKKLIALGKIPLITKLKAQLNSITPSLSKR